LPAVYFPACTIRSTVAVTALMDLRRRSVASSIIWGNGPPIHFMLAGRNRAGGSLRGCSSVPIALVILNRECEDTITSTGRTWASRSRRVSAPRGTTGRTAPGRPVRNLSGPRDPQLQTPAGSWQRSPGTTPGIPTKRSSPGCHPPTCGGSDCQSMPAVVESLLMSSARPSSSTGSYPTIR
jgi:hypothetical protein